MAKRIFHVLFVACMLVSATKAQTSVVPIVELRFRGLLGGVQNGKWLTPAQTSAVMKEETEFILVGWYGVQEGGVTLGKKSEKEDVCDDFQRMEFELKQDFGVAVGTDSKWNPMPRVPVKIDSNQMTYKNVVSSFLKKKGIAMPVVKITQAFRIDLEGDGIDEVLIAAMHYKKGLSSSAAAGDYSFVILRKAVSGKVVDHLLAGDFITKPIDFGAPTQNEISAIADLNGDGKMEIVLFGYYYEGDFASAYEIRNGRPVEIREFRIACGV